MTLAASEGRIESITLKGQQPLKLRTAFPGMIGSGQLGSNLRRDNPLQLGDQWQLAINRSSDFSHNRRSLNLNGSVTLPYGYWLLSAQGNWNDQLQQVNNQGKRWRYQGENVSQRLNINRTLWRDGQRKISGDAGISHRRITSRMAGEKLRISSPTLSVLHVGGSRCRMPTNSGAGAIAA